MDKIIICGDLHGTWGPLNDLINKKQPDIILQVGDFGWWPKLHDSKIIDASGRSKKWDQYGIKNKNTKIYFCDGNHEDHDSFYNYSIKIRKFYNISVNESLDPKLRIHEIMPNIFYCERGSVIELNNKKYLFMGGALSIDKNQRTPGIDWFDREIISQKDMFHLDTSIKIDTIISHTVPNYFKLENVLNYPHLYDSSRNALDIIFDLYNPTSWFAGHWHNNYNGKYEKCDWKILDHNLSDGKWWIELK